TALVDGRVEHGLEAVDDLRGADQQTRVYLRPFDGVAFQIRAGLGKQFGQVKIFLADAEAWQAGGERLVACAIRVNPKHPRAQAKNRHLDLLSSERTEGEDVQQV